jgi:hypothetical protein
MVAGREWAATKTCSQDGEMEAEGHHLHKAGNISLCSDQVTTRVPLGNGSEATSEHTNFILEVTRCSQQASR